MCVCGGVGGGGVCVCGVNRHDCLSAGTVWDFGFLKFNLKLVK